MLSPGCLPNAKGHLCMCVHVSVSEREEERSLGLGSLLTLPLLTAIYEQHFNSITLLTI